VHREAVKSCCGRARRAARGDARAHAGLHQQERRRDRRDANHQGKAHGRPLHPCRAADAGQDAGESDTTRIVERPADPPLSGYRGHTRHRIVLEATAGHVADPAADEWIVGQGGAKQAAAEQRPQIDDQRGADAGEERCDQIVHGGFLDVRLSCGAECHFKST